MKNKILPPNYFFIGIILIAVLYFLFPSFNLINYPYNLSGFAFVIIGIWLIIAAWKQFKKNNTPEKFEKAKKLVKDGLYAYSRNPMYVGKILFLTGLALLSGNAWCFASPILIFIIMDRYFIPYEEKKTAEDLGEDYLEYKRKVRRWI
jgi:protein-S-isoprenylcysteine O-methyltransferase Ste14